MVPTQSTWKNVQSYPTHTSYNKQLSFIAQQNPSSIVIKTPQLQMKNGCIK
jgi:hypothetical protein